MDNTSGFKGNMMNMVKGFQITFEEELLKDSTLADHVSEVIVDKMIDDLVIEVLSDVHRAFKLDYIDHLSLIGSRQLDDNNDTFFPEPIVAKTEDINCPKCNKLTHASRFAIHLEKCMSAGRTRSRIASQRLATSNKECTYGNVSDEDDDWKATAEKNKNVKKFDGKRKKEPIRKVKQYKTETARAVGLAQKEVLPSSKIKENLKVKDQELVDVWISPTKVTPLLSGDKVILFTNKCGVKSDLTGKFCGRSLRCNRHTDVERAEARRLLSIKTPIEGILDIEVSEHSKNMMGNFSTLNITNISSSKKKERQKHCALK